MLAYNNINPPATETQHVALPLAVGEVIGSNLGLTTLPRYCYYVRCATLIVRVAGMPWPKTDAAHYPAQLGLPDKGRAIKDLVV